MQRCNLERCIDSMWMLTTALFGSRLQGQECKRETADTASSRVRVHTSAELVHSILDLHCAQSILTYRQHKKGPDIVRGPTGPETPKHFKQRESSADCKRGWRKGATSKNVKNRQKVSKYFRHFSTIFAQGKKRQKSSKSVKNIFDTFRQFSHGTRFQAPFGGL